MVYITLCTLYFTESKTQQTREGKMSYQEKRAIVNFVGSIVITALYSAYMVQRYPQVSPYSIEIFRFWGAFFVILIPVSIVAKIIVYMVFHIINAIATREEKLPITDERDKLIELRSQTIGGYVFIIGFILAVGSLVVDTPPTVMFIILLISGMMTELVSDISQFYFYRRGF
jgi:Na+/H+ antiporter NhaD/arsenite permease-like protein